MRVIRDVGGLGRWHAVAASCPASPSCTSPLVGRRDPLGVGQRPGRLTVAQLSRVTAPRTAGVSRPDCPTVEIFVNKVLGRVLKRVSARRQAGLARIYGPGAVAGCLAGR
uniref:Uncharacterized protein n=1 Tax=Trichogramma kaykai TaxID=54128 RepID=A0ABD2VYZ2_9HYME